MDIGPLYLSIPPYADCGCAYRWEVTPELLGERHTVTVRLGSQVYHSIAPSREDIPAFLDYLRKRGALEHSCPVTQLKQIENQIVSSFGVPPPLAVPTGSLVPRVNNGPVSAGGSGNITVIEPDYGPELIRNIGQPEPTREDKLDAIFCDLYGMNPAPDYRSWRTAYEKTGNEWALTRMQEYWKPGADAYLNEPEIPEQRQRPRFVPKPRYPAALTLWGTIAYSSVIDPQQTAPTWLLVILAGILAVASVGLVILFRDLWRETRG